MERLLDQLDRIEEKLDKYQERISKAEADISWVKGFIKTSVSVIITVIGGLAALVYNILQKGIHQ